MSKTSEMSKPELSRELMWGSPRGMREETGLEW